MTEWKYEMRTGDRFFFHGNEYEIVGEGSEAAAPLARRICDGAKIEITHDIELALESYRKGLPR